MSQSEREKRIEAAARAALPGVYLRRYQDAGKAERNSLDFRPSIAREAIQLGVALVVEMDRRVGS